MKPYLFVALDNLAKNEKETLEIAEQLTNSAEGFGFKLNLDYLLKQGLEVAVNRIKQFNRQVFADIKMWNGTRTMAAIIEDLTSLGVDYLNVYALADNLLPAAIKTTRGTKTKVLAVTVLTHFDSSYCQKHFRRSLKETIRYLAEDSVETGCHGIILPGTALSAVRDINTIKVVPGIRPTWYKDTRHEEKVEPRVAMENGANILVCGSPIMKSHYPAGALKLVLSEIQ